MIRDARDLDDLEACFREKSARHRYPGAMAKRVHALAEYVIERHDGDAAAVWQQVPTGTELKRHLVDLPGFDDQKAAARSAG